MDTKSRDVLFSDFAVLYRMNSQSNTIERALVKSGIPYRIIGGHKFYDRKEIKDALAYLAVISNPNDNIRLRRIINEPKRGIGEVTLNNLFEISSRLGESVFSIMETSDEYAALSKSAKKLKLFSQMIRYFSSLRELNTLPELFRIIMNESGYIASLEHDEKRDERLENLDELYSTIARYEKENVDSATLEGFLEEVALLSDIDNYNSDSDSVTLMTLHSAKGLEFPNVFIVGMEDSIFPSAQSASEPFLLEEERRLAYVGITRAKERLYLTRAQSRMQFGKTCINPPSIFISEIPPELIEDLSTPLYNPYGNYNKSTSYSYGNDYSYGSYNKSEQNYAANSYGSNVKMPDIGIMEAALGNNSPSSDCDLKKGDSVIHKKFGKGLVVGVQPLGNDILLEVAFDTVGTKKLMKKMARLEKV